MTMRAFQRSPHATVYFEGNSHAFGNDFLLREDSCIQKLIAEAKTHCVVFKPMNELQLATTWLRQYDNLRIIWLVRHFDDVVNSCVRRFSSMRETLARIMTDPSNSGWWGQNISESSLQLIREYYTPNMALEDAYAIFWVMRNSQYFEQGLDRVYQVRLVNYETLVTKPEITFSSLFDFVKCPFSSSAISEIYSTSISKHEPPEIDHDLRLVCEALYSRLSAIAGDVVSYHDN